MKRNPKELLLLMMVIVLGLCCIQCPAAWAKEDPVTHEGVVKAFYKAYFMLEPDMAAYLSEDARMNENGVDMVDLYLSSRQAEADRRGLDLSYLRMKPLLVKTKVLDEAEDSATIAVDTVMIRSINPLFRIVGYLFCLLDEHEVLTTVTVVKEDGVWKVGPGALTLPG